MSSLYPFFLAIHLFSGVLFIGTVFFWTFIIDKGFRSNHGVPTDAIDRVETVLSRHTRRIMRVNVAILLLSGLAMLYVHGSALAAFDTTFSYLLGVKVVLGLLVIGMFYGRPYVMGAIPDAQKASVHDKLHYLLFFSMVAIVILAKAMFYI